MVKGFSFGFWRKGRGGIIRVCHEREVAIAIVLMHLEIVDLIGIIYVYPEQGKKHNTYSPGWETYGGWLPTKIRRIFSKKVFGDGMGRRLIRAIDSERVLYTYFIISKKLLTPGSIGP